MDYRALFLETAERLGNLEDYKAWHLNQISDARKKGDLGREMEHVNSITIDLRCSGKLSDCLDIVDEYLKEKDNRLTPFYMGSLLREKGVIMKIKGNFDESEKYLNKSIKTLKTSPRLEIDSTVRYELAMAYEDCADLLRREEMNHKSYEYTKNSLKYFFSLEDCEIFHSNLEILQQLHIVAKRFDDLCKSRNESTATLMRVMKIFSNVRKRNGVKHGNDSCLERIAINFFEIGYLDISLKLNIRALRFVCPPQDKEDVKRRAELIAVILRIYLFEGMISKIYSKKILEIIPTIEEMDRCKYAYENSLRPYPGSNFVDRVSKETKKDEKGFMASFRRSLKDIQGLVRSLKIRSKKKRELYWKGLIRHHKRKKECCSCGRIAKKMLKCAVCHFFFYCGKECQLKEWEGGKYGKHKDYCIDVMKIY